MYDGERPADDEFLPNNVWRPPAGCGLIATGACRRGTAIFNPRSIGVIYNVCSGHHDGLSAAFMDQVESVLGQHGAVVERVRVDQPAQLSTRVQALLQREHPPALVVAVGGDGTVNTVAQQVLPYGIPLGIVPMGTFNYMARALGIPLDPLQAAQAILKGRSRAVHVGRVNQWIYVNNASIGLYPYLIEQRESINQRLGRFQTVAKVSGFWALLQQHRNLKLRMRVDGQAEPVISPVIFFGNNQLQLADLKLSLAACAAQGRLAVIAVRPLTRWDMLLLMVRMQLGTFEQSPQVEAFCADEVTITSRQPSIRVAMDGEVREVQTPLRFSVDREALQVRVPDDPAPV